jgi:ubiquinone biosynthesis monooxygenase Coq7
MNRICIGTRVLVRKQSSLADSSGPAVKNTARENPVLDQIIRVDHAGEYGANQIYAGQMAVLGHTASGPVIQHMWEQEKHHLKLFEEHIRNFRARPTALLPFWSAAGYALGVGTALLGKEAAMACTVAVEEVIGEHYDSQLRTLLREDVEEPELMECIKTCRDEELEHLETGLDHDAELVCMCICSYVCVCTICKGFL